MSRFPKGLTLVQNAPRLNRSNLEDALSLIESASKNSDVIVFAELSLNGYMLQDKLYEDAWTLDELNDLKEASRKIDIVIGAALKEANGFYNASTFQKVRSNIFTIKCTCLITGCLKKRAISDRATRSKVLRRSTAV
jgi:predicted amidohydrolase